MSRAVKVTQAKCARWTPSSPSLVPFALPYIPLSVSFHFLPFREFLVSCPSLKICPQGHLKTMTPQDVHHSTLSRNHNEKIIKHLKVVSVLQVCICMYLSKWHFDHACTAWAHLHLGGETSFFCTSTDI